MNEPTQTRLKSLRDEQTFVMLNLDGRKWLLPQTELQALEAPQDIDLEVRVPRSVGAIGLVGEWWPVYCLTGEDLRLLPQIPSGRRFCPMLNNGADRFGLLCDQVETLAETPHLHPVPLCMAPADSPIQALVVLERELGCVTTTEQIARLIATMGEHDDA